MALRPSSSFVLRFLSAVRLFLLILFFCLFLFFFNSPKQRNRCCRKRCRSKRWATLDASRRCRAARAACRRPPSSGTATPSTSPPCPATSTSASLLLFIGSHRVSLLTEFSRRFFVAEDGSLKIQKLAMEDGGMFQCVAANSAGEASAYTWLKVKSEWLVDTGWFAQTGCLLFFFCFFYYWIASFGSPFSVRFLLQIQFVSSN